VRSEWWGAASVLSAHFGYRNPTTRRAKQLMSLIDKIKADIATLPDTDLAALRAWLDELAEAKFDEAVERDAKAGKLYSLISEAKANYRAGRRRSL
jgi:hypothetical protein